MNFFVSWRMRLNPWNKISARIKSPWSKNNRKSTLELQTGTYYLFPFFHLSVKNCSLSLHFSCFFFVNQINTPGIHPVLKITTVPFSQWWQHNSQLSLFELFVLLFYFSVEKWEYLVCSESKENLFYLCPF